MAEKAMTEELTVNGVRVQLSSELNAAHYDAVVVLTGEGLALPQALEDFIVDAQSLDAALERQAAVLRCPRVAGSRLVLSPVEPLTPYHDVRSVGEAARTGIARAVQAGARRILLALTPHTQWPTAPFVALLGALEALYVPLQVREWKPKKSLHTVESLGVYAEGAWSEGAAVTALREAVALEAGRALARDVGGADPERMTPALAAEQLKLELGGEGSPVRVRIQMDGWRYQYPLMAAVSRAADEVPEHRGCIVQLTYEPDRYDRTLMFVGKGVTYDTGGCDVKTGGAMCGMSRDKCGAANVAGLFRVLASLRPPIKCVATLGFVRNSVGSFGYVADELLRSRGNLAVRVGNTDAEGRLVMADLLQEMRTRAAGERAPHLYTVATLTGHAHRAVGDGYSIAMDNHVARAGGHAGRLAAAGEALGDPLEVSVVRREDLAAHRGREPGDDLLQAAPLPSTAMPRGHQGPAGFLLLVSGLHEGGVPYTHLDIAASAGSAPAPPTGATILALAHHYKMLSSLA